MGFGISEKVKIFIDAQNAPLQQNRTDKKQ